MNIFYNKNPRINRAIGYIILCIGFAVFGIGCMMYYKSDTSVVLGVIVCIIGVLLFVFSTIWMIKKVRCPHCNALLHLKLYPVSTCPYCGKRTDDV